jgi:hypothetical protein
MLWRVDSLLTTGVETAREDGELLVRAGDTVEVEALIVVVAVRVAVDLGSSTVVIAGTDGSSVDLGGAVVLATALGGGTSLKLGGSGAHSGGESEDESGNGELHLDGICRGKRD